MGFDLNQAIADHDLTSAVRREYDRLRRKGWTASDAWRTAKINAVFAEYDEVLVKLETEPEFDVLETFEPDWENICRPRDAAREKKEWHERVNREGLWILVTYYRESEDAEWIAVDSIGGFIGDDIRDNGYDADLKHAALDKLDEAFASEASSLAERPTFAG